MIPDFENQTNLRQKIKEHLTGWRTRMERLTTDSLYLFLSASALTPAVAAVAANQPAGMELIMLLGSLGTNLLANTLQKFRDAPNEAAVLELLQEALAQEPALEEQLNKVLAELEVLPTAQAALSEADRAWFTETIQAELEQQGNLSQFQAQLMVIGDPEQVIQTGNNASVITGNVTIIGDEAAKQFLAHLPQASPDLQTVTSQYLSYLFTRYRYLEFKGMGVSDRVPLNLPLLDLYIPLQARIEMPEGETWAADLRLAGRQQQALSEEEVEAIGQHISRPQPVLDLLQKNAGLIILGDPGAGKTTFLKYLVLCQAAQQDIGLGRRLPILLPLSAYANELAKRRKPALDDFIVSYYQSLLGDGSPVATLLEAALRGGQALLLLDGLDEVKEQGVRQQVVERVVQFFSFHQQQGNKFVLTSRIVGYQEVRPTVSGLAECTLIDLARGEIGEFVDRWTWAVEQAAHPNAPDLAERAAQQEKKELLEAVDHNPGVRRLAANPLLLTILALMKRQGVNLPERRVQLYDQYVKTLLKHWNLARGLESGNARDLDEVETMKVLAPLALWMHETSPGVGLVKRRATERRLVEIYEARELPQPEQAARQLLADARDHANLLVERGQGSYGFIHLTFQEYLAAAGVVAKGQREIKPIVELLATRLDDDNWREVIQLVVGYLGIVQQRDEAADEVLNRLIAWKPGRAGQAEIVAGEAVADVWPGGVSRQCRENVVQALLAAMRDDGRVEPVQRAKAGRVLARLGDPRPEVLDVDQMQFCHVPSGPFWMGSNDGRDNEKPQHWVEMNYSYWLGRFPVTNAQYEQFVADGGYRVVRYWTEAKEGGVWRNGKVKGLFDNDPRDRPYPMGYPFDLPNHPAIGVTWYEAIAFSRWLTERWREAGLLPDGWLVRLPTEAEWEKGARGGEEVPAVPLVDSLAAVAGLLSGVRQEVALRNNKHSQTAYIWGSQADPNRGNYKESGIGSSSAIGCFPGGISPYGIEEMAGNVREWLQSKYKNYEYLFDDGREVIDASDNVRVLRGGAYHNNGAALRCASRSWYLPIIRGGSRGVRVCVSPFAIHNF